MALPLRYSVGNLAVRRTRTLLTVGVIALVVLATTLFAGLVSSLRRTTATAGSERNLIVMRKGATNDGSSALSLEAFQAIQFFEGIARDAQGEPLISPELVVQPFFYTSDGGRENVLVRGVEKVALAVHDRVEIVEGRMFERSRNEALVGRGVAGRYVGAALGEDLEFGHGTWKVVGVFEAEGTSMESEVWIDVNELARDTRRSNSYSGFRLRVAPGADMDALARRIGDDPRFALEASPEKEYYAKQAESADPFYVLVIGLALLAGVGATFGATNTLYASVQARTAEIGTLRALGFSRTSILSAFLVESLAISALGLLVGGLLAIGLAGGISSALGGIAFGAQTFSTNVVELRIGIFDLLLAAILCLMIGLAGGFFPALRAARMRPVEALRKA
ncbi:MAG: multidrug ABC transporter permease [Deltaproteobacteria bacterium]|jgi:ABC-type antimicrobial peptide transport system permease subunit|nr:multidrug ABC transporter permease [Deltaproteobacteria bacterium]